MSDRVRCLNAEGMAAFERYLTELARHPQAAPPYDLLESAAHTDPFEFGVAIERARNGVPFGSRLDFGNYLHEKLSDADPAKISRNAGLWNWLSLYYFEQLCPQDEDGGRRVGPKELYLFLPRQGYRHHIRHLVRAPWLIVNDHAENAKVLLLSPERGRGSPLAMRSGIFEELATRQNILNNKTLIAAAQRLYFDERYGRTFFGASGGGAGSARRFAAVVQQLELTYDTRACGVDELLRLLPREFDDYKRRAGV